MNPQLVTFSFSFRIRFRSKRSVSNPGTLALLTKILAIYFSDRQKYFSIFTTTRLSIYAGKTFGECRKKFHVEERLFNEIPRRPCIEDLRKQFRKFEAITSQRI